jgi:hypothetical protein
MQYTKLGFNRLFKGCGSHQVPFSLIVNRSELPNFAYCHRIADEFEDKFVRLTFKGKDCFDFAYLRHTNQWWPIASELSLQQCLEMIQETPTFQPIF